MQSKDATTFHALREVSLKNVKSVENLRPRSEILNLVSILVAGASRIHSGAAEEEICFSFPSY